MDKEKIKNKQGLTEEEFLSKYDASIYESPSVTVDMLIFTVTDEEEENYRKLPQKSLKVLMVKRGDHPYIHQWALPGGFVSVDESIDSAAERELKEETNLADIYMEQLYTWGDVDRDPRTRVVSCSYMALIDSSNLSVRAGDDADEAKWFNIEYKLLEEKKTLTQKGFVFEKMISINLWNEKNKLSALVKITKSLEGRVSKEKSEVIETKGIAFDHAKILEYAVRRLRNKIEYTDIAFNLMPEYFTLTELQQVFEIILDKELLAAAFRRKIADKVIETDRYTKDAGHRPSRLFCYNPDHASQI